MANLADPRVFEHVWVDRTHSLALVVRAESVMTGSRFGGRAPRLVVEGAPQCESCAEPLRYIMTLASDVLGPAMDAQQSMSLLLCPRYYEHSRGDFRVPVVVHSDCERSFRSSAHDSDWPGHKIVAGSERIDRPNGTPMGDSKLGGAPGTIQGDEEVRAMGSLRFLWQFDEESLEPAGGPALFGTGGAVYVFGALDATHRMKPEGDYTAFYQHA